MRVLAISSSSSRHLAYTRSRTSTLCPARSATRGAGTPAASQSDTAAWRLWRILHKRHSFAVRTLAGWYRAGLDAEALLPRLSTYLGHREPRSTYRYYSDSRVIPIPAPLRA